MKRIIPIVLLSIFFIYTSNQAQNSEPVLAYHAVKSNSDNLNWIKSKIEKYGGNQRKNLSYKVDFDASAGKIIITEFNAGSSSPRFKYTMSVCDFKEVRRNGVDIEILANGTSIIGQGINSNQESAWAGIRINHFVQAESNIVKRLHDAFKSLSESSSSNCK